MGCQPSWLLSKTGPISSFQAMILSDMADFKFKFAILFLRSLQLVSAPYVSCFFHLKPTQHHQYDDNQKDQAQPAARVVTPRSTVRPSGDCPQQHQNQDDEQNRSKHDVSPFVIVIYNAHNFIR
jgi:hypothetical protein